MFIKFIYLSMDKPKLKKILDFVVRIIEVIIGVLCGTEISTFLGGPLM